jgi:uncharacterized MnhB-related membrane protein
MTLTWVLFYEYLLLAFLIVCAIAVCLTRKIITAVIIFMSYSVMMSIIWVMLQAPDLALTEAAIGAGITSVLFFLVIKRINSMEKGGPS